MMEYFEVITDARTGEVTKRPYTEAEVAAIEARKPASIRAQSDSLLLAVDAIAGNALRWAALDADTQAAWAAYRQALLDVPQQAGFPHNITWPTEPQGV